jgi:monofunctional biosynthetic peptidoglycan transglycosylase
MQTTTTDHATRARARTPLRRWAVRGIVLGLVVLGLVMADLMVTWLRHAPRIRALAHEAPGLTNQMRRSGVTTPPPWRPLEEIPGILACTVLISEDPRFHAYAGVDWRRQLAIVRILLDGDRSPGGSGIAQQLARTLYLTPGLTPRRKLREWLLAINIGRTLSHERQLELYLNVAQYGPTAFGAEQGARAVLGTPLEALTPSEAVLLAVTLPAPRRGFSFALRPERRPHIDRLVFRLWERGVLDDAEASAVAARLHQWITAAAAVGSPEGGRTRMVEMMGEEAPWRGAGMPGLGCVPGARWPS